MKTVIDQFRDPSLALLVHLVADRPKVAALIEDTDVNPEELETLADGAFAWPEKRALAVHSAAHTIMSRVYRENMTVVPAHVDATLKEACIVYGIDEAIFERTKQAAAVDDPEDYLLPDLKRLPVRGAAHVKMAEEKLLAGFTKLSVLHRAMACKRLLDKAAQYNVTLNPLMHQLAGFTVGSTKVATDWIEARKEAAVAVEHKQAFQKLANEVRRLPAELRDRSTMIKLAETLDEMDKLAGLTKFYDKKLPDPMLTVFNTTKVAGAGVDLCGKFISMERLASMPASFYGDVLGDDFVNEASDGRGGVDAHKLAAIIETLPRDMKQLLGQQMR